MPQACPRVSLAPDPRRPAPIPAWRRCGTSRSERGPQVLNGPLRLRHSIERTGWASSHGSSPWRTLGPQVVAPNRDEAAGMAARPWSSWPVRCRRCDARSSRAGPPPVEPLLTCRLTVHPLPSSLANRRPRTAWRRPGGGGPGRHGASLGGASAPSRPVRLLAWRSPKLACHINVALAAAAPCETVGQRGERG
jgi:hypothetical protein